MSTLRGFVEAVWQSDDALFDSGRPDSSDGGARASNPVWSKPDARNDSFELRRITTEKAKNDKTFDFYELYWADLMQGTTWEHIHTWIRKLLMRPLSKVPKRLFGAWVFLWVVSLVALAGITLSLLPRGDSAPLWLAILTFFGSALLTGFINFVALTHMGDAARYVSAMPSNIHNRQAIRERGVALLERLMQPVEDAETGKRTFEYDRIILVGHSLGTIIGYDILKHAFASVHKQFDRDPNRTQPKRHALEKLVRTALASNEPLDLKVYRNAQDAARAEFVDAGSPWIVSDFITIGSPLAHAEVLMADGVEDMRMQQGERNLPTSPPELEYDGTTQMRHFSYRNRLRSRDDNEEEAALLRTPHFAAHFAFTKWTNIYSPAKAIFWGDLISGPVSDQFAYVRRQRQSTDREQTTETNQRGGHKEIAVRGVLDLPVMTAADKGKRFFTHTHYWSLEGKTGQSVPRHVKVLRHALNLLETDELGAAQERRGEENA